MATRKPKKGFVYLLQSKTTSNEFKFGCTTTTPENRCKAVNVRSGNMNYKVVAAFKSFDIFADECKVKHELLEGGAGCISEYFNIDGSDALNNKNDVITKLLMVGGVIK